MKKEIKPNLTVTCKNGRVTVKYNGRLEAEAPHNNRIALYLWGKTLDLARCKIMNVPNAESEFKPITTFSGGKIWLELHDSKGLMADIRSDWEFKFYIQIK